MPRRQPPPRLLLMTDERMGDGLWPAIRRLPRGAGVVFRHYRTPRPERRALFDRVRRLARARGLRLILAGGPAEAVGWRADGAHGARPHVRAARPLLRTWPAHERADLVAAGRAGADLVLLSPVFATRSHPNGRALGPVRFGLLGAGQRGTPKGSVPLHQPDPVAAKMAAPLCRSGQKAAGSPPARERRGGLVEHGRSGTRPALIALGGMTPARFRRLAALGAEGWAAIDALAAPDQNLKVVPR